jgi:hypothetical protein
MSNDLRDLAQQALDASLKHDTKQAGADYLGVPRKTFTDRLQIAKRLGLSPTRAISAEVSPQDRIFELEAQLKSVRDNQIDDEYVKPKNFGMRVGIPD